MLNNGDVETKGYIEPQKRTDKEGSMREALIGNLNLLQTHPQQALHARTL
jgi:hypothetical protein